MMNKQRKAKGTYICANRNKVKNYKRIWSIQNWFLNTDWIFLDLFA